MQHGVKLVTTLMVLSSFVAGLFGGLLGSWQARRARPDRSRFVIAHAIAGPLVVAVGLVVVAWLRRDATPLRPTVLNLALVALGAAAGGIALAPLRRTGGASSGLARAALPLAITLLLGGAMLGPARANAAGHSYADIDPRDCRLSSLDASFSASLTVFSIDLGGTFEFEEQETAGQKKPWLVSVSYGAEGGFKLSLGEKLGPLTRTRFERFARTRLSIAGDAHLTVEALNQYRFASQDDADGMVRWAVGPYLSQAAALPGIGELVRPVLSPGLAPNGFVSPPPTATQFQLGGKVGVELDVGPADFEAKAELGSAVSVELKNEKNTNRQIVSQPDEVSVGLDLHALGSATLEGTGLDITGNGELTLNVKKVSVSGFGSGLWVPGSMAFVATATGRTPAALNRDLAQIAKHGANGRFVRRQIVSKLLHAKKFNFGIGSHPGIALAVRLSVDLEKDPEALAALVSYIDAIRPAFERKPLDHARVERAAADLATTFSRDADVSVVGSGVNDIYGDFEISGGEGITYGVHLNATANSQVLLAALYRPALQTLAVSNTCVPPP